MTFLFDENFPKAAAALIERYGHEWIDSRTEFQGVDDSVLIEEAQKRSAIILTTDRDFFHTLRHQFPSHAGLVVIALKQPNRAAILERLQWFLDNVAANDIPNRAFQLRDNTWVAQPPMPESTDTGEQG